jgi:2-hydroxychromene-2-carboxylate isomerase
MRAATYAKSIGRVVPFAQAAFRQAFAGARNLQDPDNVLIAAAACEMHPAAVLRGGELRSVRTQLADATARASRAGIITIPAIVVGDVVYEGERALEQAAAQMAAEAATGSEVR